MKFDDQRVDTSGVDDVRSSGRMPGRVPIAAGGGGLLALVVTLVLVLISNGGSGTGGALDPAQIARDVAGGSAGSSSSDLASRCATDGAIESYDDCYLVKVFNETDEVWSEEFASAGRSDHRPPRLTFFRQQVRTACGTATSQVGPFYCPGDQRIYLDIDFLAALQQELGAQGRYAQAYILAHEYGHHLQTLLGTESQVRRLQQQDPGRANELSVALELQADCLAGVWGGLADARGNVAVTANEVTEAQRAAAAVGDDRIQRRTSGRVEPESWTHGSAADRERWFTTGFEAKSIAACDTFNA